tara:strand:+ start:51 stop:254 length:204 start_codon:yes stop_codon:yes gene_type:complete
MKLQARVGWHAKKYNNRYIVRNANLDKQGCRTWEDHKGNKLLCFWDMDRDRFTTAINPLITYRAVIQ